MITKIVCPKCGAEIEAEDSAAADGVLCQNCGHDFVVRQEEPEPEPAREKTDPHPDGRGSAEPVAEKAPPLVHLTEIKRGERRINRIFLFGALLMIVIMAVLGALSVKRTMDRQDALRMKSAQDDTKQWEEENGISRPETPAYCQIGIESPNSSFTTFVRFLPNTNAYPVFDASDVLNLAARHGWQEVWVSGDGLQVIVKKSGATAGDISSWSNQKADAQGGTQ